MQYLTFDMRLVLFIFDYYCHLILNKCDEIWENLSDVAKQHFEKRLKVVPVLPCIMSQLLNII